MMVITNVTVLRLTLTHDDITRDPRAGFVARRLGASAVVSLNLAAAAAVDCALAARVRARSADHGCSGRIRIGCTSEFTRVARTAAPVRCLPARACARLPRACV